jgi:hypothetical protein
MGMVITRILHSGPHFSLILEAQLNDRRFHLLLHTWEKLDIGTSAQYSIALSHPERIILFSAFRPRRQDLRVGVTEPHTLRDDLGAIMPKLPLRSS